MRRFCLLTFFVIICGHLFAQKTSTALQQYNSLLWKVSGKGLVNPSYIYGTFHIMCKKDIRFTESVLPAIKSADMVVFEMKIDDPSNTIGGLMYLNMLGGKKLKDFYSDEEYKRVAKFIQDSVGMPIAFIDKMKPMLVESLLATKYLACEKSSGVEIELMGLAKQEKKTIKGLETVKDQGSIFDSIPYQLQAKALLHSIDSFGVNRVKFEKMYALYKAQKLGALLPMLEEEDKEMEKYNYLLLDKRNKNWVSQMKAQMGTKSLFIAVGAGHLIGKMGLISLLCKEGYKVEAVLK